MRAARFKIPPSPEALFRYLLVSQVLNEVQQGLSRSRAVRKVACRAHLTSTGEARRVSGRTLHRWVKAFLNDPGKALEPPARPRPGSLVLPAALLAFCTAQKEADYLTSVPELIRRARRKGIISERQRVSRTTLYRALKREGVSVRRRKGAPHDDKRRFAYNHRMQMILCDGKHFRAGVQRLRRVALFFLDDATRYGLDVVVGTAENTHFFLVGMHSVIRQYGLPSLLYLDRGAGFKSDDTVAVCLNLGVALIHGTAAYPEGHGKVERFHQTAFQAVLRGLDRRPDIDPACEALRLRLRHWLKKGYNTTVHESLGGKTPFERFHNDSKLLHFPESEEKLESMFMISFLRTVTNDNVISVDSGAYEMPKGYAGERVKLYRRVLTGTINFLHSGRLIELHPVDMALNARSRRGRKQTDEEPAHPLPPSAAEMAFNQDYQTLVGPDGGFPDPASSTNTSSTEETS